MTKSFHQLIQHKTLKKNVRTGPVKSTTPTSSRPHTAKNNADKPIIDPSKPHWTLQIVSDADKSVEKNSNNARNKKN